MPDRRLAVLKTYKLFIGGQFPRSESGRTMTATHAADGSHLAHYALASRKDLRDAVVAARGVLAKWSGASAYLRGQILYRAAEMLESRAASVAEELAANSSLPPEAARREVESSIDHLVHFAGWSDKYSQVFSSVNPVASPHFNFTSPEPTGVVAVLAPDRPALLGLVTLAARCLLSGNTVVALASESAPLPALSLAEAFATADLPGGALNVLTGSREELAPWIASHMDLNAVVDGSGDSGTFRTLQEGTAKNLKRIHSHALEDEEAWFGDEGQDPYRILDTVEMKTAWHPVGV